MGKCPKCGADKWRDTVEGSLIGEQFKCNVVLYQDGMFLENIVCLRRQLAAAQAKLEEAARLATDSAQLADSLAKDLAAANERAGRLEEEKEELRKAWATINAAPSEQSMNHRADCTICAQVFTRILGGA